jgi:hypothetical protein
MESPPENDLPVATARLPIKHAGAAVSYNLNICTREHPETYR